MFTHKNPNIVKKYIFDKLCVIFGKRKEIRMRTIVILEDNEEHCKQIKNIILQMNENFKILTYSNPEKFIKDLESFPNYTIFILDIMLNKANGIDIANLLWHSQTGASVIFVSSYLEKATEIYEVNHCYFVYKPELKIRLPMAIHKAIYMIIQSQKKLSVQLKDCIRIINFGTILYVERKKRQTYIHCEKETIKTSLRVNDIAKKLPDYFLRCHNSYIVNLNYVTAYERERFIVAEEYAAPISRAYSHQVRKEFHDFLLHE